MDTDTPVLDQNPAPGTIGQPQAGSLNKEALRVTGPSELQPAGPEKKHGIDQKLAEIGIKEIQDGPDLTQVTDVSHAGPHVPVPTSPSGAVQLPMSKEEIKEFKTGDVEDSKTGLAILLNKLLKMFWI